MSNNQTTDKNFQYLKDHWNQILSDYPEKYVIIHDEKVVGFYDTYEAAADEAISKYGVGSFIIHHIVDPKPVNFIFAY